MSVSKTRPILIEKPWGGSYLADRAQEFGLSITGAKIGESFEVSRLKNFETPLVSQEKNTVWNKYSLSYLVKYIDTTEHLSIQVHPDDALAIKLENSRGKTECWYIVDCKPGAGLYLGLKEGISKDDVRKAILQGGDLSTYLNFIPVKKHQFYLVPAGSIHAIGKDILLLEVQQSSGITYRLWDWNRKDDKGQPRELHVDKGLQALNDDFNFNRKLKEFVIENAFATNTVRLVEHSDFKLTSLTIEGKTKVHIEKSSRLTSLFIVAGKGRIDGVSYKAFDSLVLTEEKDELDWIAEERTLCLWVS